MSAGTKLPASSKTTSPGTSSLAGTETRWPLRSTWDSGAAIFFSAASASSARLSCTTPRMAFSTTISMITAASSQSPSSAEITEAAISRMTMKLLSCATTSWKKVGRGFSVSSLSPYCSVRRATSSERESGLAAAQLGHHSLGVERMPGNLGLLALA